MSKPKKTKEATMQIGTRLTPEATVALRQMERESCRKQRFIVSRAIVDAHKNPNFFAPENTKP